MKKTNKYVAFFDLDRTVIHVNSGEVLIKHAYKNGLMSTRDILRGLYYIVAYKFQLKKTDDIIASMARWLRGLSEVKIVEMCNHIFNKQLVPSIHKEVVEEIRKHREQGGKVVILSAAMQQISNLFLDYLKFDDCICTTLEVVDGVFTGEPVGDFCFDNEKLHRMQEYCQQNDYNISDCFYYADAFSDFAALNGVGHAVCVNPEPLLLEKAKQMNWDIRFWK